MNQKMIGIIIGIAVVVGGGSFYAGIQYQKNKAPFVSSPQNGGRAGTFGQRGDVAHNNGTDNSRQSFDGGSGQGPSGGEVIAKDDVSVTVKLRDGGSKIIFYSPSTSIMKSDAGTAKDLAIGQQIMANGTANADGSITAQSIQIRPAQKTNQ